jgi:hypothetical protein
MSEIVLCCSPADRELGMKAVEALSASGHRLPSPPPDGTDLDVLGAALSAARLCLVLVTRRWSRDETLSRLLNEASRRSVPSLLVWWDEDAPSDFLGNGGRAQETVDVFYACFLPVHDRIAALVERLRDDAESAR